MRTDFNDGWSFSAGESSDFKPVAIPHDWLIHDVNNLYATGIGRYRKEFDASFLKPGQRAILRFDGVFMDSTLSVNGAVAGVWKNGSTAFMHDITGYLRTDEANVILLSVDYREQSARWYTGAGIYRDVCLDVRNECHFVPDGIYITTTKTDDRWEFDVEAEVESGGKPYEVRSTLLDRDGTPVEIGANAQITEWSPENPRLYVVRSELIVDGQVTDTEDTRIGFRTIEYTADRGFYLNGTRVKLNGVCLHQDLGLLGAATHPGAIRRQLALFKAMGANALRTAHNPPSSAFMDLADEMGFLVMSELLDTWKRPKNENDYARFFDEWVERDAASWIRRDRNRPSVIMWSVGNEIHDTHIDAVDGERTLRRLMGLVSLHDPRGHARATLCSNYMPWENTQTCADVIKLIGYNYAESLYARHHAEHPDWLIYGSETCSTAQSRGVYHFPLSKSILSDDDMQCSALGNSATSWGARSVEACVKADRDAPFSLGQFIWAGQDYIGEPTPYHAKSCYLGHIDTAGFPKDSYYVFQAAWTDWKTAPMVHVFPYWDFSPGQIVDVRVCSNAPSVELYLNGASLGSQSLGARTLAAQATGGGSSGGTGSAGRDYIADWRVPYEPGTLRAVARDEAGAIVAEEERRSFGEAACVRLESETIGSLTFVAITAADADGRAVENANRRVRVSVTGGELLGMDNGDAADYDQYTTDNRRLFNGKALAIVKSADAGADARGAARVGVSASFDDEDIPVRKVELAASGYAVTAKILPENATYRDLVWRLTDAGGVDSPLGTLTVAGDGLSAVVTPKGDGEVYVRCCPKNGLDRISLISLCRLEISGMGKPFLDPYAFVSAGLYAYSNVELTNGNDRGVATLRDGESHVGFRDVDFGDFGSDELTLPLFPLQKEPFDFEIWEGMPLEGGELLTVAHYDRGSVWNTYQDVTYRLSRRLRGVTDLCLVFRQKVHVKGFTFARRVKAFERLFAAECDGIYGDSFTVTGNAVENIGNNVSIEFRNMDFGDRGATRIEVTWRSDIERNSAQILFDDERTMIALGESASWSTRAFPLGRTVTGKKTVTLSFLPGCKLDLSAIRFLE